MEEINKSFNIKSLQAFAEHTANFGENEPDLEAGKPREPESKREGFFSPLIKTVLLVSAVVAIILLLVYFVYQKFKKNKPCASDQPSTPGHC